MCIHQQKMPARNKLPIEAYSKIRSGGIGVREAIRLYNISQSRYYRIRDKKEEEPTITGDAIPPPIDFQNLEQQGTSGETLADFRLMLQIRPDLFLSHEEYKLLVETKDAEELYTFVHLRNTPRQIRELYRFQYHYFLASGYVQDILDMRLYKSGKTGFVAFDRLLLSEGYKRFLPENPKAHISAIQRLDTTCRCGSNNHRTYSKVCILERHAGDHPETVEDTSATQDIATENANACMCLLVCACGTTPPNKGIENMAEEPETEEDTSATQEPENLLELPKRILRTKAVWNIENKDDLCLYWSIRTATKLRKLKAECQCGRGDDCIWQRI